MNEKQQITAADLMALYNVTRPTAINWFNQGLIEGEKGEGITDSWDHQRPGPGPFPPEPNGR
jgi:hypothetical protein